jgi:hypothetical protein
MDMEAKDVQNAIGEHIRNRNNVDNPLVLNPFSKYQPFVDHSVVGAAIVVNVHHGSRRCSPDQIEGERVA